MLIIFTFLCLGSESIDNDWTAEKPCKINIEHRFVLGGEEGEMVFGSGLAAAGGDDGTIFLLDPEALRVYVVSSEGNLVHSFGQKGQGPGEFMEPEELAIDSKGFLAVFDTGHKRVMVFDRMGVFQHQTQFSPNIQAVWDPYYLDDGTVVFSTIESDGGGGLVNRMAIYGRDLVATNELLSFPMPSIDFERMNDPGFWVDLLKNAFENMMNGVPMGAGLNGNRVVACRSSAYEGSFFDTSGAKLGSFRTKFKPLYFSDELRRVMFENVWEGMLVNPFLEPHIPRPVFEKALKNAETGPSVPPLTAIVPLKKGFMILAGYHAVKMTGRFDYYNAKGKLLGSAPYSGPADDFGAAEDMFFATGQDEEDNVVLHCYRVIFN